MLDIVIFVFVPGSFLGASYILIHTDNETEIKQFALVYAAGECRDWDWNLCPDSTILLSCFYNYQHTLVMC